MSWTLGFRDAMILKDYMTLEKYHNDYSESTRKMMRKKNQIPIHLLN
jgi:hypothetical protein